jgi:hypothetical protein
MNWDSTDYIAAAILIFGFSGLYFLVARIIPRKYRLIAGIIVLFLFLYIWAELAVGIFTNWGS